MAMRRVHEIAERLLHELIQTARESPLPIGSTLRAAHGLAHRRLV
jgi:hypothetical protein